MQRCGFYIDGLNAYHAICELGKPALKWVSYARVARALLQPGEAVAFVKVFTTVAKHIRGSAARHGVLLRAWRAEGSECFPGRFKDKAIWCSHCKTTLQRHEEKETDVRMALHLLHDAQRDRMDTAFIVTTDSDLAPAAEMLRDHFPQIELVTVRVGKRRHSKELLRYCQRKASVSERMLERCRLPDVVKGVDGSPVAVCPAEYRW